MALVLYPKISSDQLEEWRVNKPLVLKMKAGLEKPCLDFQGKWFIYLVMVSPENYTAALGLQDKWSIH